MINTQFALECSHPDGYVVLDYSDDIAQVALDIANDGDGSNLVVDDLEIMFPCGECVPLSAYVGRTAGQDAEVEEDDYDELPVGIATIVAQWYSTGPERSREQASPCTSLPELRM